MTCPTRTSKSVSGLLYISTPYSNRRVLREDKHFRPALVKSPPTCHELDGDFFHWRRSSNNSPIMTSSKRVSMSQRYDPNAVVNVFVFDRLPVSSSGEHHCFSSPINDSSTSVPDNNSSRSSVTDIVSSMGCAESRLVRKRR